MKAEYLKANAEIVVEQLRPLSKMDFGYNGKSVEWLEGYIDRLRQSGQFKDPGMRNQLIGMFGSFIGQCIIECYGGQWIENDGIWGVAFDPANVVFPFAKVTKQMDNGLEDGISSMFNCIPVLYGKSLKVPAAQNPSPPSVDDLMDLLETKTRKHHYLFAHRELPGLIWGDPELYASILFDFEPEAEKTLPILRDFLFETWAMLGNELPPGEQLPPDGLEVTRRNLPGDFQLVVITMPPATQIAEAHMIAIAYRPEPLGGSALLRYFTLELGMDRQRFVCTMFCEWTREDNHVNYGEGPPVGIDTFCKTVESKLNR